MKTRLIIIAGSSDVWSSLALSCITSSYHCVDAGTERANNLPDILLPARIVRDVEREHRIPLLTHIREQRIDIGLVHVGKISFRLGAL